MKPILPTVSPQDTGSQVANLQDALFVVLRKIIRPLASPNLPTEEELNKLSDALRQEREESTFGKATYQLVVYFQIQEGLGDHLRGVVEAKTAAKLNELLRPFGVFDEEGFLIVRGTVKTADDQPIRGARVHAFDRDMRKEQPLGDAETDDLGAYIIRYGAAQFSSGDVPLAPAPKLIVRAFLSDQKIGDDVAPPNPTRDEVVDFKVPAPVVSEWEQLTIGVMPLLKGQGKDDQTLPPWEINDRDLDFIAEETGLDREQIRLWALAFAVGRDASEMQPGAPISPSGPSTFLPVTGAAGDLAIFAIFYGWFRLGLPSEPVALWATPSETLRSTLSSAITQGIVPANLGAELGVVGAWIEQNKLDYVLKAPALGTVANLGDLFATLPVQLNLDQQRVLAGAMPGLRLDDPELADSIAKISGFDGDAAGVARTLRLGDLTGGHLPLAQILQRQPQLLEDEKGTLRPLAALRPDEWIDLAYTHGTPSGLGISPVAYADALAESIELQHPTAALAAHVAAGRRLANQPLLAEVGTFLRDNPAFDIEAANLNALAKETELGGIPETKHPQLVTGLRAIQRMRLLTASLDETATLFENDLYSPHHLLAAGPGQLTTLLDGQLAPERVVELHRQAEELHDTTLATYTAVFSPFSGPQIMSEQYREINPDDLGGGGLPGIPPGPFPDDDGTGGPVVLDDPETLLARRSGLRDPTKFLIPFGEREQPLRDPFERPPPVYIPREVIDYQPTLARLFGDQDACACGHCNSVLGPAAYFVDVLEFVRKAKLDQFLVGNPDLGIPGRRPDLYDLELSCNNTNTVVPAIDLVIEILENAVVFASPLEVPLLPGTRVEDQLISGQKVGAAVRAALGKTARSLGDEVRATAEDGAWTVVDGYRRWRLTARPEGVLVAAVVGDERGATRPMPPLEGVDLQTVIAALNEKRVASGAEAAFARLFAENHEEPPDLTNYAVTITPSPQVTVKSWRVEYQVVAQLHTKNVPQVVMQTVAGAGWWDYHYSQATISAIEDELSNGTVPELVQTLLASRFYKSPTFTVTPAGTDTWTITSAKRELTLRFIPAHLNITSLTYQSGDPSADAVAWPENHNPAAYEELKKANFPWSLPVDLPLEEVRLFLERARTSRLRLIELMLPMDEPLQDSASFALEVLGLSEAEATRIGAKKTAPEVYGQWGVLTKNLMVKDSTPVWGYSVVSVPPLDQLKNVSMLLQQSRLSFEELQAVFATRFISGATPPLRIEPQNTCKPSEMRLPALTPEHLDRLHRFTRLWRKLGWTVRELDLAIEAFGGQLTPDTLLSLARVRQLQQQLDLPVASLVAGLHQLETQPWADPLTEGALVQSSLYAAIFQRKDMSSLSDFADFALQADGEELAQANPPLPTFLISTHADYIGACLGIKASVVTGWVLGADSLGIENQLNLANLSRLSAAVSLCRALHIRPEQLIHHLKLYGTPASPFRTGMNTLQRTEAMLKFVERFRGVEASGIDVETLRYLLQHYPAPSSSVTLDPNQLKQFAAAARDAVRSIPAATEKSPPFTPAEVEEAAKVAQAIQLAREDAAMASLATSLGMNLDLVNELLRIRLRHPSNASPKAAIAAFLDASFVSSAVSHSPTVAVPPSTAAVDPALKVAVDAADKAVDDILVRLNKTRLICDALKLNLVHLRLLPAAATDENGFTALDFNTLPVAELDAAASLDGFTQLLALAQLRGLTPGAGDLLHQYAAIDFAETEGVDTARTLLATGLDLEKDEVEAAANQLRIADISQYRDPLELTRLIELLVALKQLGATVGQAAGLTAPSPDDAAAVGARELLRSKYGAAQWHDLIKPIADRLRERQRSALVDYLIARDQRGGRPVLGYATDPENALYTHLNGADPQRGADGLYERYLIDVQIGTCLKTTRLLLATAAVQLFVQRVLLNLERGASLTDDKRKQWDWMRSYRVWEANRKVFLFPENWLLPELRDDKTAIFRQMESALTEQEPSPEITRAALLGYLEELGDLAQISVIAMYEDVRKLDTTPPAAERTLYVVGRTPNTPYRYFWRSCAEFGSKNMSWSGWEALDLDNANDFIMPFVMEGDLHVAWPIFRKTKEEKNEERDSANLLWEVQLAWTRRTNKGWIKRKIGKAQLNLKRLPNKDEAASFAFRFNKKPGGGSLAGEPVKREKITFDCYAAEELDQIPSLTPDPSLLLHVDPIPTDPDQDQGHNKRWNVSCVVQGIVYKFFNRTSAEGGPFYIGCEGATVSILDAKHRYNSNSVVSLDVPVQTTRSDGAFKFSFPTPDKKADNGGQGLFNEGSLKLRIEIPGWPTFDKTVTLVKQGPPVEYAFDWIWTINHGVEDKALDKKLFPSDRKVKLEKVGAFVLETGRDLSSIKVTTKDPYVDDMAGFTANNNWLSVSDRQGTPPSVVRATQSLGRVVPDIWSIKESDDSFCYLQLGGSKWRRWPDRHPFASIYRLDAATSNSTLFRLENQMRLHLDPAANNFGRQMPYANYNWELFLHTPLAIADYLASQQRFEDARRWLHAIFDPTTDAKIGTSQAPQFWRFLVFQKYSQPDSIAQMLTWLADPKTTDPKVADFETTFAAQIEEWRKNPFMPHVIARLRPSAYQWHTFFAYLDLLIGWGDQLFRRDTRESVNEATLLYVLAAKLLGPRPRVIRAATPPHALTYRLLQANENPLDGLSNTWVDYALLPGVKQLVGAKTGGSRSSPSFALRRLGGVPVVGEPVGKVPAREPSGTAGLASLSALAFCIPQNEKVTEFYDRVENRLFNVRNCRNIEGVFRDLPLYEPPIDPLLLIRARAAGLDINSVLDDLYAPLPNYRFSFTLQKALELCGELKSLGGALLSALEKKDAEQLTLLRSSHEIAMLKLVRETRQQQIAEAEANIVALQQSEATILERFGQYQKLLGKTGVTKGQDGLPVVEQSSSLAVSTDAVGGVSGLGVSRKEVEQLGWTATANTYSQAANSMHLLAGVVSVFPTLSAGAIFASSSFGGLHLGAAASAIAKAIEMGAVNASYQANLAGTFAGYERRQDEWVHQSKLALAEVKQIQKQILAAEIRKSIATHELSNHDKQMENAQQVDEFMRGKFTSQQLYRWMSSQIAQVYFRTYQLALDQARRAERAYQHELGLDNNTTPFVKAGNWDSLKRGLLAGEHLHHDLKRMEGAFLERNVREFEITKHISLLQLNPGALIALRQTDSCDFELPEVLFDLDYPGHYMRRIKMVSLSIPCVTGPYASVSATLKLIKNEIRAKPTGDTYKRLPEPQEDPRFMKTAASITAVVTSSAQQDSGMFEPNLRDERYLPFEGAGVISTWRIELPSGFRAFDYDSIADVVLHVRYTARNSDALKATATASDGILSAIKAIRLAAGQTGMARLFSLRHEFPTEWAKLMQPTAGARNASFPISKPRFPFFVQDRTLKIKQADLFGVPSTDNDPPLSLPTLAGPPNNTLITIKDGLPIGNLVHKTTEGLDVTVKEGDAQSLWTLSATTEADIENLRKLKDIIVVFGYTVS